MNTILKSSLYYSEGNSDKEYHAEIVSVAGGSVVNYRYGRRGSSLSVGTKTSVPVEFTQAKKIYDKLVKDKLSRGYTLAASGTAYQGTELAGRQSDFLPQLLNPITELEMKELMTDTQWAAQVKMDGERRAVHADGHEVIGINRKGLIVPLPEPIVSELQAIAANSGTIRIDGEIIGDTFYAFDLHLHQGINLHTSPWSKRMRLAQIVLFQCKHFKTLSVAVTPKEKRSLCNKVKLAQGEGIVFKRLNSPVSVGRPNSGGDWLKFKFTESASCCVMEINVGKRSVKIGLMDKIGHSPVSVGNVTIPPNYPIPAPGNIVEVEYLYAYRGGSLYQPVYRGIRADLDINACTFSQLKYKPEGLAEDEVF